MVPLDLHSITVKPDIIKVNMTPSSTGMVHQPNHSPFPNELWNVPSLTAHTLIACSCCTVKN